MSDPDRLVAYLTGPVDRKLKVFSKKLGEGLLRKSGGAKARAEFWRFIDFDEDAEQLVVTVMIEVRISGPDTPTTH